MNRIRLLLIGASLLISSLAAAQQVSPEILEQYDAIVLNDEASYNITNVDEAYFEFQKRVLILNEDGMNHAVQVVYYDGDRTLEDFQAESFDQLGNRIKKLKNSEFIDQSMQDGFSVYQDNRIRIADLRTSQLPFIVEISYKVKYNNLYSIPDWYFSNRSNTYILKSKYTVSFPESLRPKYKLMNGVPDPIESKNVESKTVLVWEMKDLAPLENEKFSGTRGSKLPAVLLAPNSFTYGGFAGSMDSWEDYGHWMYNVNTGRNVLSSESQQKVLELTKGLSEREKIKTLYEYMQNHTRYVSIQLGFGGLQPFLASEVESNGYGDCKALTNYMHSLLNYAGIPSYYTLVDADDNPREMYDDFVYHAFNHVILAVPQEADTVWLECTSQRQDFNFLGSFTSNRKVLMVTPEGGKVVKTPTYDFDENQYHSTSRVILRKDNSAAVTYNGTFKGLMTERDGLRWRVYDTELEKKKWINDAIDQSDVTMSSWDISRIHGEIPEVKVSAEMDIRSIGRKSGKRIFITPNMFNRSEQKLKEDEERSYDIILNESYTEVDTIEIDMGVMYPERLPEPFKISSEFGEYEIIFDQSENILTYIRKLRVNSGEFDPSKYDEFVRFVNTVYKQDKARIVLRSET